MSLPEYVTVWICEQCGNYYGASNVGDLLDTWNYDMKGKPTFPRARCPTPSCAIKDIMRKPIRLAVPQPAMAGIEEHRPRRGELPLSVADVPDSPRWSGELCDNCSAEMVRTGNCLTCPSCGSNTGCG